MTKVYAVHNDNFKFQEFCLPITDLMDAAPDSVNARDVMKFHSRNLNMKTWWQPIPVQFQAAQDIPEATLPDICLWRGFSLVLSPYAYTQLSEALQDFGEFLPVSYGQDTYYIFNCLTLGLADEINSQQDIQDGVFMGVKKLSFNDVDISGKLVFKTEYNRCSRLYCSESFKQSVEESGLKGLAFNEDLVSEFS